jgi:hypothetical protein
MFSLGYGMNGKLLKLQKNKNSFMYNWEMKVDLFFFFINEYEKRYGKVVKNVSSDNKILVNYLFYTGDIKGMIDDEVIDMNDLDENEILENINKLLTIHNTIKKIPTWHKCFFLYRIR